jgi:uncharacterized membrane protein
VNADNETIEPLPAGFPAPPPPHQPAHHHHHRREGIGLMGRLRAYFLAGILVTAPLATTFYIAWWFVSFIDGAIRPFIPSSYNPEAYLRFSIPGIGVLTVLVLLTVIGAFTAGYVGRLVVRLGEGLVARMPVVRGVYSAVKQIVQTVLANKSNAFREVVMVQYPRQGVWSLGFITGQAHPKIQRVSEETLVNVFIPCAPPTTGYLVFVPRREVVVLDMKVEDGLKLVVSAGIVNPPDDDIAIPDSVQRPPPDTRTKAQVATSSLRELSTSAGP